MQWDLVLVCAGQPAASWCCKSGHHHTSLSADALIIIAAISPCCWVSHKGLFAAGGQSVGFGSFLWPLPWPTGRPWLFDQLVPTRAMDACRDGVRAGGDVRSLCCPHTHIVVISIQPCLVLLPPFIVPLLLLQLGQHLSMFLVFYLRAGLDIAQ
jgi:hypothetical protein